MLGGTKMKKVKNWIFGLLFLSAFGFLLTLFPWIQMPRTVQFDDSLTFTEINGYKYHTEIFGQPDSTPVIMVHGGPGQGYEYMKSLKDLSKDFRVIFYDQRGAGLSPRVDKKYLTPEQSLDDLDSVVRHFSKGGKVKLIGHSWGAMLVSGYLGRHSEKVRRAVLAEPGYLTTEMARNSKVRFGPRWELGFWRRATRVWFESLHISGPDKDASGDYFLGEVAPYSNPEYFCNNIIPDAAREHLRVGSKAAQTILRSTLDADGNIQINLTDGVDRFKEPVLFLAGGCDRLIGEEQQLNHAKLFPNATVVVIPDCGHFMFCEKPDESIRVVRNYLRT
jgi:proline iminopeptidase